MRKLPFTIDLDQYTIEHIDEIHFKYHINTFDYPSAHSHKDYWEFTILTEGSLHNYINGKKETYTENTLFFATPYDTHYLKKYGEKKLRYINIAIKEDLLTRLLALLSPSYEQDLLNGPRNYPLPVEIIYKIEELLYKINLLENKQLTLKNNLLYSAILLIIQHLFASNINIFNDTLNQNLDWMQKLSAIMQNNEFPTYTVQILCEKLGYSRMQLNRLFKTHLGTTPHKYLNDYKLRYAKSLLQSTDMKILNIAMLAGYSTLSQFQLNFKKAFNMTPGQYRKAIKTQRIHTNDA